MTAILSSISLTMGVMFIAYVAFILVPYLRYPPTIPGDPDRFEWHIFVPCRDEAVVIGTTIERARSRFPTAHLWVIDDDSEDETSLIAGRYASEDTSVHLVQRRRPDARTGKGDALNSAYHALNEWLPTDADRSRIIVAVVDADGEMAENALEVVAADDVFGNDVIGAAQIAVWMKNRDDRRPYPERGVVPNLVARWLIRAQDVEFRTVISAMQSLRQSTGTVGLGGNGQFTRLAVLDQIGERYDAPWHGALLEDYELGVHVLLAGYQIKHVFDTHVSQEALPSVRRLLTQRTRWAQGNIQCVRYIPDILKSKHVDSAGALEASYYLVLPFLQVLGIVSFLTLVCLGTIGGILHPELVTSALGDAPWLLGISVLFGVGPFLIWGPVYKLRCEPTLSWGRAILYGFGTWLYVYSVYVCIVRAFIRVALGRNGWSKTRRNAESAFVVDGSVAIEQ